jgi:uncharacterized protein
MQYNPVVAPDPADWLATDEQERLYAIQCWVSDLLGTEIEDCLLEVVPILAIENQVAGDDSPVTRATLQRLLDAGIERMTAIQVMSDVMADGLRASVSNDRDFDAEAFVQALQQIDPADISLDELDDEPSDAADAVPEISADQRRVLIEFGERHAGEKAMSWPETAGFLYSVMACPEMIMPSEWSEIVQGDAVFGDLDEARAVTGARMVLMNWISEHIRRDLPAIPWDCRPDSEPMRMLEGDNNFSRWCRGVTTGHLWLEDIWHQEIEEDSNDDRSLGMALIIFSFFGDRKMAEKVVEETARESGAEAMTLEETASRFHEFIDQAIIEFAAIGLDYRRMPSPPLPRQPVRSEKIGRNQPCSCGSGRKYKKCCGGPGARHH